MTFIPPYSVNNAEPTPITNKVVDDPFGVADHGVLRTYLEKIASAFSFWHQIDNSSAGQQGFSKQIRNAAGAGILITPAKFYGGIITFFTARKTAAAGAGTFSKLIEDASATGYGVDWRKRLIWATTVVTTTTGLPSEGADNDNGFSVDINSAAVVNPSQNISTVISHGMCYTETGSNANTAPVTYKTIVGRSAPATTYYIHASDNVAAPIAAGDLLVTFYDQSGGGEDSSIYGIVIASPPFEA